MNRLKIILLLLLSGGIIGSARLAAQQNWRNFDFVKQSDARLTSENAALLKHLSDMRISTARLFGTVNNGDFVNYFQSPQSYIFGAETESYYRVNSRLVFYGLVGYENFTGKRMGGSAFIAPQTAPFNIVESADTTRGAKQMETYRLSAGISYELSKKTTIGSKIEYTAANYAKRKDLRHRNKLLDLTATLGGNVELNEKAEIGLNAFYRKRVEGVFFNTYGTTDIQYVSLIDFGSSYGRTQAFTEMGDGYTSGKTDRPLVDKYYGGSLQFQYNLSKTFSLFHQLSYKIRDGYYGIKSSSSVVYTNHNANAWAYLGSALWHTEKERHRLDIGFETESLQNFENIFTIENEQGGFSYVVYHDKNKMLDRKKQKFRVKYSGNFDVQVLQPKWTINAEATIDKLYKKTSVYPYFRKQDLTFWRVTSSLNRNFFNDKRCLGIALGASLGGGSGLPFTDGVYAQPSSTEKLPQTAEFNLYAEYDYLTALRIGVHPAVKYSIRLKEQTAGSVSLQYSFTQAQKTEKENKNNQQLLLAFGLEF